MKTDSTQCSFDEELKSLYRKGTSPLKSKDFHDSSKIMVRIQRPEDKVLAALCLVRLAKRAKIVEAASKVINQIPKCDVTADSGA